MFARSGPLRDPVRFTLDGEEVVAERGESLAVALVASGRLTLARSPKLHRPRGPTCLRGACDGCLVRLDGAPNVMACLVPARGGEKLETQNFVGSRSADLLRVTDWFFPHGIDHHHLMAGVPGLQDVMQAFARKVAGLGRLPQGEAAPGEARRLETEVLVVGGGLSGVALASALGAKGRKVLLVDDQVALGGSLPPPEFVKYLRKYPLEGPGVSVEVLDRATAAGVHAGEVLVARRNEAWIVRARIAAFATGAHDGALPVPNGDLPGVMSARAFHRLLGRRVEPVGPVGLVGRGYFAGRIARKLGEDRVLRIAPERLVAISGSSEVRGAVLREVGRERKVDLGAVAISVPGAPTFEVAAQAGARVRFDPRRGYAVDVDEAGRAGPGLFALGECTGKDFAPRALALEASIVASSIDAALESGEDNFSARARP